MMLRAFTLRPPVILDAITTLDRREASFASQRPMIRSVSPSGFSRVLGMGYCSCQGDAADDVADESANQEY